MVATSVLSAVGIVARTRVDSGGIYSLISQVLGSRAGGAIGLIYCFGQVEFIITNNSDIIFAINTCTNQQILL